MTLCRALPFVAMLIAVTAQPASAQFGGMPGMPGSMPGGFGAPPPQQGPPPECQQLLTLRDETQKHASLISAANQRHAPPPEACKLFRNFIAAENRMIKAVTENGPRCGVPPEVPAQMKAGHARALQVTKQVCDAAAQGPRAAGPSLSDALGTTPAVPSTIPPSGSKAGGGPFDTLTGNALAR
jgi:hypothetical protein